jgi:hypothetical protein
VRKVYVLLRKENDNMPLSLAEYLLETGQTQREFASKVGISCPAVNYLVHGRKLSKRLSDRVADITDNKVILSYTKKGILNARWKRILDAKRSGVSFELIADRFGYKNSRRAYHAWYYAERMLNDNKKCKVH